MSTKKKMLQAAAGNAGGEALNVEDVFSTYLYEGTGAVRSINNGIDLDGEGGLVWIKKRDSTYNHMLFDTERGPNKWIRSDSTAAEESAYTDLLDSFNSNGFTLDDDQSLGGVNYQLAGENQYASWTFRKAPKFFDVVTYTGTGSVRTIAHSLGATVGSIFVKCTSTTVGWPVYHRGVDATAPEDYFLSLNSTNARGNSANLWNDTAPTDSAFTVGAASGVNESGLSYVAYLFAHNDGDGEFGPDGDADIIKCGSLTVSSQATVDVNLGFEAQWVMLKHANSTGNWFMFDTMRGMAVDSFEWLYANTSAAAETKPYQSVFPTATGFGFNPVNNGQLTDGDYIYIAIRRGTKVPESGTEVFEPAITNNSEIPRFASGFPVDAALQSRITSGDKWAATRLTGSGLLKTNLQDAEADFSPISFDYQDGYYDGTPEENSVAWMWKRAPKYFDVVAYTGNGTAGRTVSHNLGVAPEMIWVKNRDQGAYFWVVGHSALDFTSNEYLRLNDTNATGTHNMWNSTAPTNSVFSVGSDGYTNASSDDYIAYLFATLAGISKVGNYTGNGTSQTIDCGFTSGARFVMTKRTDVGSDWVVWDTARGIVAGNDSFLVLNDVNEESSSYDNIDPYPAGFTLNYDGAATNISGAEYIFYAIA